MQYIVKEDFVAEPFYYGRSTINPNTIPLKVGDIIDTSQAKDMLGGDVLITTNDKGDFVIPADKVALYTADSNSKVKAPVKFNHKDVILIIAAAATALWYYKFKR